ncbi:Ctf8-domain-containing protein [Roridomyces roridus]|uniref:Ctf8-domain-containing protein n=1 Tax=Roridomyces roridus TaxID=1738132 RepID=A0AAD7CIE4_9AGAR|nr:Ctf8-domain-containing protein [Roridomyces roridus]
MFIPIHFTPSSSSSSKLPPALAQISHDEVVLIELNGALEVECTSDYERDGKVVGRLVVDANGKSAPTLAIGHHLLEGKLAALPKPLAVLRRVTASESESNPMDVDMDCDPPPPAPDATQLDEATSVSWDALAIVKRKIVFLKRPTPIMPARVGAL